MFKLSRYYKTRSFIHSFNPLLKLILTILFIISIFFAKTLMSYLFLITFILIIMIASNVPAKEYLKSIWYSKYFLILLIILDFIFFQSGIHLLTTIVSMILIILMTSVLIFTTTTKDLVMTFEILLTPLKIFGLNPRKMAFSIMLAIRFIPILLDDSKKIMKAMKNRNQKSKETLQNKVDNIDNMVSPLVKKSVNHADHLADVMEVRNYSFERKIKYILYSRKADYLIVTIQILIFVAILMEG